MKYGHVIEYDDVAGLPYKPGDRIRYRANDHWLPDHKQPVLNGVVTEVSLRQRSGHPHQYDCEVAVRGEGRDLDHHFLLPFLKVVNDD